MVKHNKNFKSKKKQSLKKKALRKTKRKGGKKSIKGGVFEGRRCQSMSGLNPNVKAALNNILVAMSSKIVPGHTYYNRHIKIQGNGNVVINEEVQEKANVNLYSTFKGTNPGSVLGMFGVSGGKAFNFAKTAKSLGAPNISTIYSAYDQALEYLLNTSDDNFRSCYNIACVPKKSMFNMFNGKKQSYDCSTGREKKIIRLTIDGRDLDEILDKKNAEKLDRNFLRVLVKIQIHNPNDKTVVDKEEITRIINTRDANDEKNRIHKEKNDKIENNENIMDSIDNILSSGELKKNVSVIKLGCTKELNIYDNNGDIYPNYGLDENEVSNHGWDLYYQYKDLNTEEVKTFLYKSTSMFSSKKQNTHFKNHLHEVINSNIVTAIDKILLNKQSDQLSNHGIIKRPPGEKIIITRETFSVFGVERDSCKQ